MEPSEYVTLHNTYYIYKHHQSSHIPFKWSYSLIKSHVRIFNNEMKRII